MLTVGLVELTMLTPPDSSSSTPTKTSNSLSHLIQTTFSYDGNIMLAAIISLLLVILFVLLLHLYAKWFLAQARQRRRNSMSVSHVLRPTRFHNFPNSTTFTFDTSLTDSPSKGLDPSIISSIPVSVYNADDHNKHHPLECVVCLSVFEDCEIVRNLPKCGHVFHVECIDMWLHSHSSCPICRAPVVVVVGEKKRVAGVNSVVNDAVSPEGSGELPEVVSGDVDSALEITIEVPGSGNGVMNDSASSSSSSPLSSQSSQLGCSLKRMLSRNRSESKIHPSSNVSALEVLEREIS